MDFGHILSVTFVQESILHQNHLVFFVVCSIWFLGFFDKCQEEQIWSYFVTEYEATEMIIASGLHSMTLRNL